MKKTIALLMAALMALTVVSTVGVAAAAPMTPVNTYHGGNNYFPGHGPVIIHKPPVIIHKPIHKHRILVCHKVWFHHHWTRVCRWITVWR